MGAAQPAGVIQSPSSARHLTNTGRLNERKHERMNEHGMPCTVRGTQLHIKKGKLLQKELGGRRPQESLGAGTRRCPTDGCGTRRPRRWPSGSSRSPTPSPARPEPWCPRRLGSPCGTGRRAPGS
jgi:hypothetical protein